jgi:hypothetical protein
LPKATVLRIGECIIAVSQDKTVPPRETINDFNSAK